MQINGTLQGSARTYLTHIFGRGLPRDDPYLDGRTRSGIDDVIHLLDHAEASRTHVEQHRNRILGRLEHRREVLEFGSSRDKRPVPDREGYDPWRDGTDEAVEAAEGVLANRRDYGIHLDGLARRGADLASALSTVRRVLADDDRHIAASLVGQGKSAMTVGDGDAGAGHGQISTNANGTRRRSRRWGRRHRARCRVTSGPAAWSPKRTPALTRSPSPKRPGAPAALRFDPSAGPARARPLYPGGGGRNGPREG